MSEQTRVVAADLGPSVAAFTCCVHGQPVAVVNQAVKDNPAMRTQAAWALLCVGLDAGEIIGALHGIRG